MLCPTCGADGYDGPQRNQQSTQSIRHPLPQDFGATAYLLEKSEKCEDGWKQFLRDMRGRSECTEKQWKFFKVIHKNCLGSWPREKFEDLAVAKKPEPANSENWSDDLNDTF